MSSSDAPDEFFGQLLARLDGLQSRLSESESQVNDLTSKNRELETNLETARIEAKSAREELQQEATRSSLLEQQLSQATQARDKAIQSNKHSEAEKSAMDSTLTLVQRQLSTVKSNLSDLQREKDESTSYYESMLQAKETSISSLQQLMDNLKQSHAQAIELYEDQLSSLRSAQGSSTGSDGLLFPPSRKGGHTEDLAAQGRRDRGDSAPLLLRGRVSELESLLMASTSKLEQMSRGIKERDKLLQRAERKIQDLNSALDRAPQHPPPPPPPQHTQQVHTSHTFVADSLSDRRSSYDQGRGAGGEDHLSPSRPLRDALRLLKNASLDKRELQAHLELIQSSFAEERRRREVADSQLIFKAEESRLLSRKLEAEQEASLILRSEVNGLRDRLTALASQANDSIDMARKESEVLHSIKIETLNLEIDRMRVRHEEALRAAEVLHRQKLSSELESHRAKVRALEDELASAVSSAAAASASLKATKDQQTLSLSEHRTLVQQRLDQQRAQSAREIDEMRKETRSQLEHKERELRSWYEQKLEQASHAARSHSHKEREEALREVQKRCERLQAESTEASEQVHRSQRLIFLIRSHWASLRKHLSLLHTSLSSPPPSSSRGHKRATPSSRPEWNDLLDTLMKDWDASGVGGGGGGGGIEMTVEKSFSAASALVEAASEGLTSLSRSLASAVDREEDAEEERRRLESHEAKKIQNLDLELQRSIETNKTLTQKLAGLEADLSHCQAQLATAQVDSKRHLEAFERSEATADALGRKLSQVESDKSSMSHSLRQAQGSHGSLGSQLQVKEGELQARVNEVNDLRATIALLHERIEGQEREAVRQLDELKAELAALVAVAPAPDLLRLPNGPMAKAAEAQAALAVATANAAAMASSGGPAHIAAMAHQSLRHLLSNSISKATASGPQSSLPWHPQGNPQSSLPWHPQGKDGQGLTFNAFDHNKTVQHGGALVVASGGLSEGWGGVGGDAGSLSAVLEESLGRAQVEVQSFVARIGQIEVWHWELSRGLSGVERARGHLGSLVKELQAGRHSVALVLANEMAALMDAPTSSQLASSSSARGGSRSSHPSGTNQGPSSNGPPPPSLDVCKVAEDLKAARLVSMELASSAKTSETMLAGLAESLPGWIQLIKAESKSRYRQDLSKVRSVVDSKLHILRRELKDLRDSISTELRSATQQLLSLSSAALLVSSNPGQDQTMGGGMGSMVVDGALSAALSADLVLQGRGGGERDRPATATAHPPPPPPSATGLAPNLLSQLDAERRAMAKGLEGLISELGACLSDKRGEETAYTPTKVAAQPSFMSSHKAGEGGGGGKLAGPVQNLEGAIRSVRAEVISLREEKAELLSRLESASLAIEEGDLKERNLKEKRTKALSVVSEALGGLPPSLLASSLLLPFPSPEQAGSGSRDDRFEPEIDPYAADAEVVSLRSLERLREASHGFLSHIQQVATEATSHRLRQEVIEPLEDKVEDLSDELDRVKKDLLDLQEQVHETLVAGDAALVAVREEAESAAYDALDGALSVIRLEVQGALERTRELQSSISDSWSHASQFWVHRGSDQRREAEGAVRALEGIISQLQSKLRDHSLTLESTKEELLRSKKEQSTISSSFAAKEREREEETTRLRLRVKGLEKKEEEMEAQARDLRRVIKRAQEEEEEKQQEMALLPAPISSFVTPLTSGVRAEAFAAGIGDGVGVTADGLAVEEVEEGDDYPWRKYLQPGNDE